PGGRARALESDRSWRESIRPRFSNRGHSRCRTRDEFCRADGGAFERHVQSLFHIKIAFLSCARRLCAGGARPFEQTWHACVRGAGLKRRDGGGGFSIQFFRSNGFRLLVRLVLLRRPFFLVHVFIYYFAV